MVVQQLPKDARVLCACCEPAVPPRPAPCSGPGWLPDQCKLRSRRSDSPTCPPWALAQPCLRECPCSALQALLPACVPVQRPSISIRPGRRHLLQAPRRRRPPSRRRRRSPPRRGRVRHADALQRHQARLQPLRGNAQGGRCMPGSCGCVGRLPAQHRRRAHRFEVSQVFLTWVGQASCIGRRLAPDVLRAPPSAPGRSRWASSRGPPGAATGPRSPGPTARPRRRTCSGAA